MGYMDTTRRRALTPMGGKMMVRVPEAEQERYRREAKAKGYESVAQYHRVLLRVGSAHAGTLAEEATRALRHYDGADGATES